MKKRHCRFLSFVISFLMSYKNYIPWSLNLLPFVFWVDSWWWGVFCFVFIFFFLKVGEEVPEIWKQITRVENWSFFALERGGETWKEIRKRDMSWEQTIPCATGYSQVICRWNSVYPVISSRWEMQEKGMKKPKTQNICFVLNISIIKVMYSLPWII